MLELQHELRLPALRDDKARMNFVSAVRSHVLHAIALGLRRIWDCEVAPRLARAGRAARTGAEVHRAPRAHEYFRFHSAVRVTAQDMLYQSVRPVIERGRKELAARATRPHLRPARILDLGCAVGHNTGAWKDLFPEAEVHGIDVSAPCLRYAQARARSQGRALELRPMNAEQFDYTDGSFDLVFSSMFLHEVPRAGISRVPREAHRVLRSGG